MARFQMLILIVMIVATAAALLLSAAGKDVLARAVSSRRLDVSRVIGSGSPRDLYALLVRHSQDEPGEVVLAETQDAVLESSKEGKTVAVSCVLTPYRIIREDSKWTVAVLPAAFGWLGRSECPHGGDHPPATPATATDSLAALLTRARHDPSVVSEAYRALRSSELVMVNVAVIQRPSGPSVQLPVLSVRGLDFVPAFTSEQWLPPEPGLRISRHPFKLLLKVMRPPNLPLIINVGRESEFIVPIEELQALSAEPSS